MSLEKLKVVSDQCLSCHHDPDNEDKLVEINRLVEEYEVALRNYLTAQEDEEATAALRIFATALLEKIKLESETMSLEASVRLDKISNTAMTRIQRTWLILPFALALLLCLGIVISAHLVRSVTDPIEKLVEATEIISSGGIGHQIEYSGEVEFEKLTRNFNTMSSSLKGNIDRLHSANEDLQREIEKREQAERKQEKLQQQLLDEQRMESVSTLSAGIAHEFTNIFHVILRSIERMANKPCDVAANEMGLALINNVARRGVDVTQGLLTFCEDVEGTPIAVDINDRVQRFAKHLEEILPKSIEIRLGLAEDLPPITAAPNLLEHILMNLALNARDSMPDGGVLSMDTSLLERDEDRSGTVSAEGRSEWVMLTVTDTGCGMSDEAVQHVFDPFFTRKDVGMSTGLGLATAYGIVQSCGGQIDCESTLGRGSLFKIRLPAQEA